LLQRARRKSRFFLGARREGTARLELPKLQPTAAYPGVAAKRCSYLANNVAWSQQTAIKWHIDSDAQSDLSHSAP
jgi:hypothetical protein